MKRALVLAACALLGCRERKSMSGVFTGTATVEVQPAGASKTVHSLPNQVAEVEATWHYNAGSATVKLGKDCFLEGRGDIVSLDLSSRGRACSIEVPGQAPLNLTKDVVGGIRKVPDSEFEPPTGIRLELRRTQAHESTSYTLDAVIKPK